MRETVQLTWPYVICQKPEVDVCYGYRDAGCDTVMKSISVSTKSTLKNGRTGTSTFAGMNVRISSHYHSPLVIRPPGSAAGTVNVLLKRPLGLQPGNRRPFEKEERLRKSEKESSFLYQFITTPTQPGVYMTEPVLHAFNE